MGITSSIMIADVMHKRVRPKVHGFNYRVYYLCFALSQANNLSSLFLSLNKWNLFSFYKADHGQKDGSDLEQWIRRILIEHKIYKADGEIILVTLPRILGYVFNPVSFWFCLDHDGKLRAVLSEVNNTFGETHSYLSAHDDQRVIEPDDWLRAEKLFHVSPFMDVAGHYQFRFTCTPDNVSAIVNHEDAEGLLLSTSVRGCPNPLTASALLSAFFRYPLVTLKVISLIHWEAVRLVLKGIRYRSKPIPPISEVSR